LKHQDALPSDSNILESDFLTLSCFFMQSSQKFLLLVYIFCRSVIQNPDMKLNSRSVCRVQQRDFAGQTVLITGAGGGVGRALVELFASRGADLILSDQSEEAIAGLDAKGRSVFDLSNRRQTAEAAFDIVKSYGAPDVLINNAGWTRAETIDALDTDKIGAEVDLNLTGVVAFTDVILKAMAQRGSGSIVFISSVNALAHFGNPAYAAAKAGINAYARAVAVEYGCHGVRANSVCPGLSARRRGTTACSGIPPSRQTRRALPARPHRRDPEVAEAVAFLASSRASGITGIALPVDAGLTAGNRPFIDQILG
jgi:NAD(P)-dependent dehydrogenase (short-subunit alcohol dehydrogenase family)